MWPHRKKSNTNVDVFPGLTLHLVDYNQNQDRS